jgi:hypothetical protein
MPLGLAARYNLAAAGMARTLRGPNLLRRPRAISIAFDRKPVVGEPATLRWRSRRAGTAQLRVEQEGVVLCETAVAANGFIPISILTAAPIQVSLALYPIRLRADSEPVLYSMPPVLPAIPRPRFARFEIVPAIVSLGGEFTIVWDAPDATGVDLVINNGRTTTQEALHPSGVRTVIASRAGMWMVRITAQGKYAALTKSSIITVTVPPPRIKVERRVIAGPPGTRDSFSWTVTDAVQVHFRAPAREQRCEAPPEGFFAAEVGQEVERFYLIAIGLDGRRTTVELRTEPYDLVNLSGPES